MQKTYTHITLEERAVMQVMLEQGQSLRHLRLGVVRAWPVATAVRVPNAVPKCCAARRVSNARWSAATLSGIVSSTHCAQVCRPSKPAAYCCVCPILFASATSPSTPPCTPCPVENCERSCCPCCQEATKPAVGAARAATVVASFLVPPASMSGNRPAKSSCRGETGYGWFDTGVYVGCAQAGRQR